MKAAATDASWLEAHTAGETAGALRRLWRVGAKVDAVVLRRLTEQTYLMRGGGLEWIAQSEIPLEEKQRIRARVRSTEPVISLQILEPNSPDAAATVSGEPASRVVLVEFEDQYKAPVELVYKRAARRGRKNVLVHQIAMLLDLDGLGTVGVRATLNGRYATFEIQCRDIRTAEALQESVDELERSLSLAKIVMANLSIDLWPENPPQVGANTFRPQGYERIDWTV